MNDLNVLGNEAAMTILRRAADSLKAIGVDCMLAPMSLPQGMTVSLHAGATAELAHAANVASTIGGEMAHSVDGHEQFSARVACDIADAALHRAAAGAMPGETITPAQWELIGRVPVDSAQLVLVDPCYIDGHWEQSTFQDIRRYRHSVTGDVLQYRVDFDHYEAVIPKFGKTMNQLNQAGECEAIPVAVPPGLSYNSVSRLTINEAAGEVGDLAVAFRTGYGDGHYPVFVRKNDEGRVMQVLIDFRESEDSAIALGLVDSQS